MRRNGRSERDDEDDNDDDNDDDDDDDDDTLTQSDILWLLWRSQTQYGLYPLGWVAMLLNEMLTYIVVDTPR